MKTTLITAAVSLILSACTKTEKVDLPAQNPASAPTAAAAAEAAEQPAVATNPPAAVVTATTVAPTEVKTQVAPADAGIRISGQVSSTNSGAASFKIAGHIAKINVQEGARVRSGQVLAELDQESLRLKLRTATEQLQQKKRDLGREEQLKTSNATTEVNYERVKYEYTLAQINFEEAERNLRDTQLVALYDAVVAKKIRSAGEYVAVGAQVFELSSLSNLEVSLKVPESLFKKIKVGQNITITVPSIDLKTYVNVNRVVPVIETNTRTFTVIGRVTDTKEGIMPGQFVEAQF